MNIRHRTAVIPLAVALLFAGTSAQARGWAKRHQTHVLDGEVLNQWTTISTIDDEWPFFSRMLYQDASGDRLVLRLYGPAEGTSVETIIDVATGESVIFSAVPGTMTVTVGTHQMVVTYDEAFHTTHGFQYSAAIRAEAATLYATLPASFKAALLRLTQAGCLDSIDLYPAAVNPAYFFYDGVVNCSAPPRTAPESTDYISPFDPLTTGPNAYEQSFGQAYFE